jgi:hypothetical protein
MFEELIERLKSILAVMEGEEGHIELTEELKSIIEAIEESKCSNGMFCGMDKKW